MVIRLRAVELYVKLVSVDPGLDEDRVLLVVSELVIEVRPAYGGVEAVLDIGYRPAVVIAHNDLELGLQRAPVEGGAHLADASADGVHYLAGDVGGSLAVALRGRPLSDDAVEREYLAGLYYGAVYRGGGKLDIVRPRVLRRGHLRHTGGEKVGIGYCLEVEVGDLGLVYREPDIYGFSCGDGSKLLFCVSHVEGDASDGWNDLLQLFIVISVRLLGMHGGIHRVEVEGDGLSKSLFRDRELVRCDIPGLAPGEGGADIAQNARLVKGEACCSLRKREDIAVDEVGIVDRGNVDPLGDGINKPLNVRVGFDAGLCRVNDYLLVPVNDNGNDLVVGINHAVCGLSIGIALILPVGHRAGIRGVSWNGSAAASEAAHRKEYNSADDKGGGSYSESRRKAPVL